jgi:glucokinase
LHHELIENSGRGNQISLSNKAFKKCIKTIFCFALFSPHHKNGDFAKIFIKTPISATRTMMYFVGVDIGGSNVRIVIADHDQLLVKISSHTVRRGPPESLAVQICNMIERGLEELGITKDHLIGIGTSSAGPFVNGESLATPNICGVENDWHVIPYLQVLRDYFGKDKRYELANDCVSSVKAEHLFGAGKGYQNCVYITISTGVGGGIICNNLLLEGKGKNAGHIGHMIIAKDGPRCGCGQTGCIESFVSGKSILRRAKEAGFKSKDGAELTTKDIFDAYRSNDPIAKQIIQETIEYLGMFFINVINVTDTEVLIVGGSVFLNNMDVLLDPIQHYISNHSMVTLSEGVQFKPPELMQHVGDLAGLAMVIPSEWIGHWQTLQPWKNGIRREIFMPTDDAMNYKRK